MGSSEEIKVPFLALPQQHVELKSELMAVFSDALDQARFIGGPNLEAFESEYAAYIGSRFAVGVNSGTDALRFILLALGIGSDSLALTVPNTFIATTEAISQAGARFDFVDIDAATCLMDPNRLEDDLKRRFDSADKTDRPDAIVPVHLYGQCADMAAIIELADRYEIKVIEDAAQAHGALHRSRRAGTFGLAAAFSFYPGKNLGACGEAGAITTDDESIAQKIQMIRDHGQARKYVHQIEGYNGRLDAIQAGFLRVKLRRVDEWNQKRRRVAQIYDQAFAQMPGVRPVSVSPYNEPVYHLYVIHVSNRDGLQSFLNERGIQTGLHYPIPLHLQECYQHLNYTTGSFPDTEKSAAQLLSLPMFPELEDRQIEWVIESIREYES